MAAAPNYRLLWSKGSVEWGDEILPVCPVCHEAYSKHPALSRRDSETLICPDCGLREALADLGFDEEVQEEIIASLKENERKDKEIARSTM